MEIKIDIDDFEQVVAAPASKALDKAVISAANKTAPSVRLFVQKHVGEQFQVKRKPFTDRVGMMKANRLSPYARLSFSKLRNLPRVYFAARSKSVRTRVGPRKGVTAIVNGSRQQIKNAFLATMPNGKVGVFERKGASRTPIRQLFGKEIKNLFEQNEAFLQSLSSHSSQVFSKNFDQDFAYFLSKQNAAATE